MKTFNEFLLEYLGSGTPGYGKGPSPSPSVGPDNPDKFPNEKTVTIPKTNKKMSAIYKDAEDSGIEIDPFNNGFFLIKKKGKFEGKVVKSSGKTYSGIIFQYDTGTIIKGQGSAESCAAWVVDQLKSMG